MLRRRGEWDDVVVLVTSNMHECHELVERLFLAEPSVKRLVALLSSTR